MTNDNEKNEIPVVFAADSGYTAPLYVAISSLIKHANRQNHYRIIVLVRHSFPEPEISYILSLCTEYASVEFCLVEDSMLSGISCSSESHVSHISIETYLRLFIPRLIDDCDRCIYLDADILVMGDIAELYCAQLNGNYIGGVRNVDIANELKSDMRAKRCDSLRVSSLDKYVNAGVLLLNLARLRSDGICEKWLECAASNDFPFNDQDVINSVCYPNIQLIDYRFNYLQAYFEDPMLYGKILGIDFDRDVSKSVLLHYASSRKPWISRNNPGARYWWDYIDGLDESIKSELIKPFAKSSRKNVGNRTLLKNRIAGSRFYKLIAANKSNVLWWLKGFAKKKAISLAALFKHSSVGFGKRSKIEAGVRVKALSSDSVIAIGDYFFARENCHLLCDAGTLEISNSVFLNYNVSITCLDRIEIGSGTTIANNVVIVDHDHGKNGMGFDTAPIVIGENVWIGANAVVLKGVTIGSGAVIAAGAVVVADIEEGMVVGGVPARPLHHRA